MKPKKHNKFLGIALIAFSIFPLNLSAQTNTKAPVSLTIDAKSEGAVLHANVFGQFAEHLGTGIYDGIWVGPQSKIPNTRGIRNDVVAALKPLKIPNVRWPGGCFADDYKWRNGIGPQEQRPKTLNALWGGVIEPNSFGTHEFMDFIDQIGSNAYISGNMGSGTPREMSDWLEYMTAQEPTTLAQERRKNGRDAPFKVKYFGVGNETWGCGGSMRPEYYADQYRQFASYVRNFDPKQKEGADKMLRIASGANIDDYRWTEEMMKITKDIIFSWGMDGLSLHYYSGFNQWPPHYSGEKFGEDEYAHVLKSALKMETLIQKHSAIMDKYDPEKKVALVVDEWGTWYKPAEGSNPGFLQQQNSIRDALVAGIHFNVFMRNAERVRMANVAQMINVLQAMILTKGDKMILTPSYHVFKMYVPFHDSKVLKVNYDAGKYVFGNIELPKLDIAAVKAKDGKIYLSIVNLDANNSALIDANQIGFKANSAVGQTITHSKIDAINTFENPNNVLPKDVNFKNINNKLMIEVPKHSVSVLVLN